MRQEIPEVIYLQWFDPDDGEPLDADRDEVTWCRERINDSDIAYRLVDEDEWIGLADGR